LDELGWRFNIDKGSTSAPSNNAAKTKWPQMPPDAKTTIGNQVERTEQNKQSQLSISVRGSFPYLCAANKPQNVQSLLSSNNSRACLTFLKQQ
jgi:hypothetical protein